MESFVIAVGFFGTAAIGVFLLWLVGELAWAAIVTASWLRWQLTVAHHNGGTFKTVKWRKVPGAVWRHYVGFLGYRQGAWSCTGSAGYWRGIGQWNAWPAPSEENETPSNQ